MKQQETVRIPVHSLIDLITNSSTEIFVHSEKSVEPAKALLTELLKLEGSDKTCDDVFEITIEKDRGDLNDVIQYYLDEDDRQDITDVNKFIEDVSNGTIEPPDWWDEVSGDYHVQTNLVVKSKDKKYDKLVNLLKDFLYSPEWYEHNNG